MRADLVAAFVGFFSSSPFLATFALLLIAAGVAIFAVGIGRHWPTRQEPAQQAGGQQTQTVQESPGTTSVQGGQQAQSVQGSPGAVVVQGDVIHKTEVHVHIYQGGQAPTAAAPAQPSPSPSTMPASLVQNGGFEQGTIGWGTGFYETFFGSPGGVALMFNNAVAQWSVTDQKPHTGRFALRVDHSSTQANHVFSSLSQGIKVQPGQRYEVKYWAYLESTDRRGSFSLRVLPRRPTTSQEWDRFRRKIDPARIGAWQEVRLEFDSGNETDFDLRFAAETAMKLYIDDVSVTRLPQP